MNDIEMVGKKVDALIDALGFDVTHTTVRIGHLHASFKPLGSKPAKSTPSYTVEYKLTKRPESPFQWMGTNSDAWSAIVEYVLSNKGEIEEGVNDFGVLMPVLNHFYGENDNGEVCDKGVMEHLRECFNGENDNGEVCDE